MQFGDDPGSALVLDDLTPASTGLLDALDGARPTSLAVADAVARGGAPDEVTEVLVALSGAGLLVPAARRNGPPGAAYVRVHGAGRVGMAVATLLAAAGVGRVAVRPCVPVVAPADVGTGLRGADVGRPATLAAAEGVARAATGVVVAEPTRRRPDLVVLTGAAAVDPVLAVRLPAYHQPHLVVTARGGAGVVGPLVLPGRSSCLRCADLHRAADPAWPRIAAQLAGRPDDEDVATATAVAALAVGHALAYLRDPATRCDLIDAVVELDPARSTLTRRDRPVHDRCGCSRGHADHPPERARAPRTGDNRGRDR